MAELTLQAKAAALNEVLDFVDSILKEYHCPLKVQMQVDIAIEEIFVNIAHYAYEKETGPVTIRVETGGVPLQVSITFMDKGIPYDPLKRADPDVQLSAEERDIGGLGIFMVKKSMDNVSYVYRNGRNILTLEKKLFAEE